MAELLNYQKFSERNPHLPRCHPIPKKVLPTTPKKIPVTPNKISLSQKNSQQPMKGQGNSRSRIFSALCLVEYDDDGAAQSKLKFSKVHCTLYSAEGTVELWTDHTGVQCITVHCAVFTFHCSLLTVHCSLCSVEQCRLTIVEETNLANSCPLIGTRYNKAAPSL